MADKALCTVVINSCDRYADIWGAFFTLLDRYWPDRPWPMVLNTETVPSPRADVPALHTVPGTPWTRRLQGVLARLGTPYVLLILDDFFLTAPVDTAEAVACLRRMEEDRGIACFSFYPTTGNTEASAWPGYEQRPQTGLYRFNAQVGLWRREQLMGFLDADEDAWEWEEHGNARSFAVSDRFYSRRADAGPVFPYDFMEHGLIGGKWFPATETLFADEGIPMDFSRRGFYDPGEWALLPSTAAGFSMDSVLYVDTGAGMSEAGSSRCPLITKTGPFSQRWPLPRGARRVRWDPSTHKGFALRDLRVSLRGPGGRATPLKALSGNAVTAAGMLCFLQEDPQLTYPLPRFWRAGSTLEVTGVAVCPLSREQLHEAQAQLPPGMRTLAQGVRQAPGQAGQPDAGQPAMVHGCRPAGGGY